MALEDATPVEREAVLLRWRAKNPNAPEGSVPTEAEQVQLLSEIRDRASAIEGEAFKMLMEKMRITTANGANSRHSLFVFSVICAIIIAAGVYAFFARFVH